MATPKLRGNSVDLIMLLGLAAIVIATAIAAGGRLPEFSAPGSLPEGEMGRRATDGLALANIRELQPYPHVRWFDQVPAMEFLSEKEVGAYRRAGASTARMAVAPEINGGKLTILVVQVDDRGTAKELVTELTLLQSSSGVLPIEQDSNDPVKLSASDAAGVARALYHSEGRVARLEFAAQQGGKPVVPALMQLLPAQLSGLPPS